MENLKHCVWMWPSMYKSNSCYALGVTDKQNKSQIIRFIYPQFIIHTTNIQTRVFPFSLLVLRIKGALL